MENPRRPLPPKSRQRRAERFATPIPVRNITPAEIQRRLSYRLRQIIGPRGLISVAEAARLTEINPRTLKAYIDGSACPNLARYGRLLRVFGPEVGIELALMLGWEPRAAGRRIPHAADVRELRETVAQAIRAIDLVIVHRSTDSRQPIRRDT